MAKYKNGYLPSSILIKRGEHLGTAGSWAKWDALVADVKKNEGVTLRITSGDNFYRDYAAQVAAKKKHGSGAAAAGTSSHGGVFKGRDALAIDVANWGVLGKTKFFNYARKHGFEPNYFHGQNGSKAEPWHIIDWDPFRKVGGTPTGKPEPKPEPQEKEDEEMTTLNSAIIYLSPGGTGAAGENPTSKQREVVKIFNTDSGFETHISSSLGNHIPQETREQIKSGFNTVVWGRVSEGVANAAAEALAETRKVLSGK